MSKNIAIFASVVNEKTRASFPRGLFSYNDVAIIIDQKSKNPIKILVGTKEISTFDLVYFRTWRKYALIAFPMARYLKMKGVKIIDTEILKSQVDSKTYEYICAAEHNVPIPRSIIACKVKLVTMKKTIHDTFTLYPLIVKAAEGKQGRDNFLVKNFTELKKVLSNYPNDKLFIVQEYIPNNFDYRFLVTGYKTALVYKRIRTNEISHLNNISQGGLREIVDANKLKSLCKIAEKISKALYREVCGVDIIISTKTGEPYVLEANSGPQLNFKPAT
ncbi:MAG: Ribosomal protein S6 modification protein [Microgenomates bacterium OLB23]|nr:MAG: Ribosomal protein S6 modification protein [Microgenomates bacterium OLB23]